jgi:hypothetical protein
MWWSHSSENRTKCLHWYKCNTQHTFFPLLQVAKVVLMLMLQHLSTKIWEWKGSKAFSMMLEEWVVSFTLQLLLSGEDILLPVCHEAEWIPQPVQTQQQREISLWLPGINPGHPANQLITFLTDLSHFLKATNTALFTNHHPLYF